jgi:CTP:molybdopterin cytidylyltransferase MocA
VRMDRVRTVVLAGGRSRRMGFDKLVALFDGMPLARRVALGLRELEPLFVATPAVAEVVSDLRFVRLVVTQPTAGPAVTLALAHAAIPHDAYLAVLPCDVPFLDAAHLTAFVVRVPDDADLAWPVVGGTPGHPVLWSPKARARIPALGADEPPSHVRRDPALDVRAIEEHDDAYVTDADTPDAWAAAEARTLPPATPERR